VTCFFLLHIRSLSQGRIAGYPISKDQSGGVGLAYNELRRVHWSKEASSYFTPYCFTPYWSIQELKVIRNCIKRTLMEAIVGRWCCPIGGNNFVSPR
jgi:hypothetical protein